MMMVTAAMGQTVQKTDTATVAFLRLKGEGIDTTWTLRLPPGNHAVLPPAESRRGDTLQRVESASLYRRNYLAGNGITLQFVHVGQAHKAPTRAQWIVSITKNKLKEFSAAQGTAELEMYRSSGIELRYRHTDGELYRAAYGPGANVILTVRRIRYQPGEAIGGFGRYTHVMDAGVMGTLVSSSGKPLKIMGIFSIGLFAPEEEN
jgi:hypothetical protein